MSILAPEHAHETVYVDADYSEHREILLQTGRAIRFEKTASDSGPFPGIGLGFLLHVPKQEANGRRRPV